MYDILSHTVREWRHHWSMSTSWRYTLTYSEETPGKLLRTANRPIYPHLQWRNDRKTAKCCHVCDIPSLAVREPTICNRLKKARAIYPHLQWGNVLQSFNIFKICRYTLTCSEGTFFFFCFLFPDSIYPHLQWGNAITADIEEVKGDIPSLAVREHSFFLCWYVSPRYTLTCSEGTLSVYAAFSRLKHLVVQIAQKIFSPLLHIFNMQKKYVKRTKIVKIIEKYFLNFYTSKILNPYSLSMLICLSPSELVASFELKIFTSLKIPTPYSSPSNPFK